jgi:hypothetical protein
MQNEALVNSLMMVFIVRICLVLFMSSLSLLLSSSIYHSCFFTTTELPQTREMLACPVARYVRMELKNFHLNFAFFLSEKRESKECGTRKEARGIARKERMNVLATQCSQRRHVLSALECESEHTTIEKVKADETSHKFALALSLPLTSSCCCCEMCACVCMHRRY